MLMKSHIFQKLSVTEMEFHISKRQQTYDMLCCVRCRQKINIFKRCHMKVDEYRHFSDPVYYALDMNRIFATPTPEHQVDGAITLRTGLLFEPNRKSTSLAACRKYQ